MKALEDIRIVFMGTPEFAVASLDALLKAGCNVVGVITAPDKPAGRGMQMQQSAVKQYATQARLPVLQPEKLKQPEFLAELQSWNATLQVVVAFRMLPELVWNMPPMGSVNLHGSLLPQYRGAAPINWAVINGEAATGVTTFKLQHTIDTGNILLQEKFPIAPDETAGDVHDRMKIIGAALLLRTVQGLAAGTLTEQPQPQSDHDLKHAPKIFTETCRINFDEPVSKVYNLIRGLAPFPGAFCTLQGKKCKVLSATKEQTTPGITAGEWNTDEKTYLRFACSDGWIYITELQLEGKKRMKIEDFLRGYRF